MTETRTYSDGTTATGPVPLPAQSPAQQSSETGPCDKCGGGGKLFDRRIGDVVCDECHGHGWFNEGVAGPATEAPHELVCAINRGGKCTCSVLDQSSRADLERMAQAEREHDEAVREGEASEQEGYGPVALSAIKFIEQLPAEARGKRGDAVLRGLRQLVARACGVGVGGGGQGKDKP
jgi:hypothetical protein